MAKDVWTNLDIQDDPQGYLEWQKQEREREARELQKRRDEDDLKRYTEEYVAAGGSRNDAAAAWRAHLNEQAAASALNAARLGDEQARERGVRHISSRL
jgi:hypothetical protein